MRPGGNRRLHAPPGSRSERLWEILPSRDRRTLCFLSTVNGIRRGDISLTERAAPMALNVLDIFPRLRSRLGALECMRYDLVWHSRSTWTCRRAGKYFRRNDFFSAEQDDSEGVWG